MPMKLNLQLAKKIGLPGYGSLGVSCGVELELPHDLVFSDLDAFQRRVLDAYAACDQAVQNELARHQQAEGPSNDAADVPIDFGVPGQLGPAFLTPPRTGNGNGGHQASEKQVAYLKQLAKKVEGLGICRLETLSQNLVNKPLAALSSFDASRLIDALKRATSV